MIKPLRPVDIMVKNDKVEYLLRLKGTTYSLSPGTLKDLITLLLDLQKTTKPTNWSQFLSGKSGIIEPVKGLF